MESCTWDYHDPYEWLQRVKTSTLPPLAICCAISGGVQGKETNPNLPETPEEQVEQTRQAYQAGASMVHIHARNPEKWWDGSGDVEKYYHVNAMIRRACPEIVINNTTGGSLGMTFEQRLACLDANPEVATLNMGPDMSRFRLKERRAPLPHPRPTIEYDDVLPVTYGELAQFAQAMKERGIKPEMEIYQPGQFWGAVDLIDRELVAVPYLFQFVMGAQTAPWPTPANLLNMVEQLPAQSIYEVSGIGPFQLPMTTMAIVLGAQMVRVGMEDNVYYRQGRLLKSNVEAVERVVRIARELNREIATPAQTREMLGLGQTPSQY
jgi:3-keto-5-aminohexanoate cleavage enzyme